MEAQRLESTEQHTTETVWYDIEQEHEVNRVD